MSQFWLERWAEFKDAPAKWKFGALCFVIAFSVICFHALSDRAVIASENTVIVLDGLSMRVSAGLTVDRYSKGFDYQRAVGRGGRPYSRAIHAADPDIEEAFVHVEPSGWRRSLDGFDSDVLPAAYDQLASKVRRSFPSTGETGGPQVFEVGSLPAYGTSWSTPKGVCTCAYLLARRKLFVLVVVMPKPGTDAKQNKTRALLTKCLASMRSD
jgi:hypothetical protein